MQTRGQLLQQKDKSTKGFGPLSNKARLPRKKLTEVLLAIRKTKKVGMSLFLHTPASHPITLYHRDCEQHQQTTQGVGNTGHLLCTHSLTPGKSQLHSLAHCLL